MAKITVKDTENIFCKQGKALQHISVGQGALPRRPTLGCTVMFKAVGLAQSRIANLYKVFSKAFNPISTPTLIRGLA